MTGASQIVCCAATGCNVRGLAVAGQPEGDGKAALLAPPGWGELEALSGDGSTVLVLFVCSPACERRVARGIVGTVIGNPDG